MTKRNGRVLCIEVDFHFASGRQVEPDRRVFGRVRHQSVDFNDAHFPTGKVQTTEEIGEGVACFPPLGLTAVCNGIDSTSMKVQPRSGLHSAGLGGTADLGSVDERGMGGTHYFGRSNCSPCATPIC